VPPTDPIAWKAALPATKKPRETGKGGREERGERKEKKSRTLPIGETFLIAAREGAAVPIYCSFCGTKGEQREGGREKIERGERGKGKKEVRDAMLAPLSNLPETSLFLSWVEE